MKTFVTLALLAVIALNSNPARAQLSCEIDSSISSGTNSVIFTLTPSPLSLLTNSNLKSPAAVLKILDSDTNPVKLLSNAIMSSIKSLLRFTPFANSIPTCKFLWSFSELHCDNVPSFILKPLCGTFSAIKSITKPISFPLPQPSEVPLSCEAPQPWGLANIKAQYCWSKGARGAGVVVANLDAGVRYTHEEVRDRIRSFLNWFDGYGKYSTPKDDTGHGTHTMGTIVGKTLGVAPDATWIACKGCDTTGCGNLALKQCMQWLYCPDWNTTYSNLNCSSRPQVINHSWGGGVGDVSFHTILRLMKNAGIVNFFSAGNSGPLCATVVSPADSNGTDVGTISVGATACNENIGAYSSAGPSQAADYMLGLGVELVAPGSNILSAWHTSDNATSVKSGTSMSSPHAAGVAAVLLSANPSLTLDEIRSVLRNTAYKNTGVNVGLCNIPTSTEVWPNNVYGYGRIDCEKALDAVTGGSSNSTTTTSTASSTTL